VSAVLKPHDSEQEFLQSQQLPPDKRGISFEALFFRQLQAVTTRIHATENIDEIMLEASADICKLFNADRLTLYAVNEDHTAIISKIKTGLNTSKDLKLPISAQSLAGYVALSRQLVNIADVYDDEALKRIHPNLSFLKEVDKRSGYRTKQMLVVPILEGNALHGVLQVINNKSDQPFGELEVEGATQLCKTLATAIHQRMQRAEEDARRKATKYDGLIAEGVLTQEELREAVQKARSEARPVEQLLMEDYSIRAAQIGPSLSKFFGGPTSRSTPGASGWSRCRARSSASSSPNRAGSPGRRPRGAGGDVPGPGGGAQLAHRAADLPAHREVRLARHDQRRVPADRRPALGRARRRRLRRGTAGRPQRAAGRRGRPGRKLARIRRGGQRARQVRQQDHHRRLPPARLGHPHRAHAGKAKTGIRLRIDGSLTPYVEVPAHFRQALVTRLKIMCDLDISERRKPQDGKIKFKKYGPLDIELRVATIPTAGGVEDVVMRILAAASRSRSRSWD